MGFNKNQRDTEIELPYNVSIYSTYVVNSLGDEAITINIVGDCVLKGNNVDNFGTSDCQTSIILFMKPIDVANNELWKYSNEDFILDAQMWSKWHGLSLLWEIKIMSLSQILASIYCYYNL